PWPHRADRRAMSEPSPLAQAQGVSVSYRQGEGWVPVLDAISFDIAAAETFGLAGESGCGKSTMVHQFLGYAHPMSRLDGGRLLFKGADILAMREAELARLRGNRISLVPQNPTTALSPGMRVGEQIVEVLLGHEACGHRGSANRRVAELFDLVRLPDPARIARRYP